MTQPAEPVLHMRLARNLTRLTPFEKLVALDWIEKTVASDFGDPDNVDAGLLAGIIEGWVEISGIDANGHVTFRLSEVGETRACDMVMTDPELQRMFAALRDANSVDGPKDPQ